MILLGAEVHNMVLNSSIKNELLIHKKEQNNLYQTVPSPIYIYCVLTFNAKYYRLITYVWLFILLNEEVSYRGPLVELAQHYSLWRARMLLKSASELCLINVTRYKLLFYVTSVTVMKQTIFELELNLIALLQGNYQDWSCQTGASVKNHYHKKKTNDWVTCLKSRGSNE